MAARCTATAATAPSPTSPLPPGYKTATTYRTGVAVGDVDNDGDLDLYVGAYGPNVLYRNNGDGTFTDTTAAAGVGGGATDWTSSVGFVDYDRDGDLDLFVVNYLEYSVDDNPWCGFKKDGFRTYCNPTLFDGTPDRLFRNRGDGTFEDVSIAAGVANPAGKGLGFTFCDVDADGWPDIYVANDLVRNFLYHNSGDGTFKDITYGAGVGFDANGKPQAGMGVDCGDIDGDGRLDLFVTNFSDELNSLYVNLGDSVFEERSAQLGLGSGFAPLGFGTRLFDMDNDGDLDIYVTNGHVIDNVALYTKTASYAQRDLLYANDGGRFTDVSAASGTGLQIERVGRGLAAADYDGDGDVDLAIANMDAAPVLLRNDSPAGHHWLTIRARGRASNRFGLGARITVVTGKRSQVRDLTNGASYLSAHDTALHVGLGGATTADRVEIAWPSGARQVLTDVAADRVLVVEEPERRP
jgi:enediyne biosynthesis protein E4